MTKAMRIRQMLSAGKSTVEIASDVGCTLRYIYTIRRRSDGRAPPSERKWSQISHQTLSERLRVDPTFAAEYRQKKQKRNKDYYAAHKERINSRRVAQYAANKLGKRERS